MPEVTKSGNSRVHIIRYGSGPSRAPMYMPNAKAGTPSVNPGDVTTIWGPDPHRYNNFVPVDEVQAGQERTTMDMMGRYPIDRLSELLSIAQSKCPIDVLVPIGTCRDPSRINSGWDKLFVLLGGKLTTWTTDRDLGALEPGDNSPVNEQSTVSAALVGEIDRMRFTEVAGTEIAGLVSGLTVCDNASCGDCGVAGGDGCQRVFALSTSSTASPSASNDLLYSVNGGTSWTARAIPIAAPDAEPEKLVCVGDYLMFLIQAQSLAVYIPVEDVLSGTGSFGSHFLLGEHLRSIYSVAPDVTWIGGDDGMIWLVQNPVVGLIPKLEGTITVESIRAIHAYDEWNVVGVGTANTVVASNDMGDTWRLITGPAVGVTLTAVWMRSANEWLVGTQTGYLYYTIDGGDTWTAKAFPGWTTGVVRNIQFARDLPNVGYLAHSTTAPAGRILRTVDGGSSWYVLPEPGVPGSIPTNDYISELAVCHANRIYAGGLAGNGTDGIILIGSPA